MYLTSLCDFGYGCDNSKPNVHLQTTFLSGLKCFIIWFRNIHPGSAVLHALNAQRTGQGTLVRALTVTIFTYLKSNLIKVLTSNHLEIVQVITEFAFTYEAEACYAPALNTHHKRITTAVAQVGISAVNFLIRLSLLLWPNPTYFELIINSVRPTRRYHLRTAF